MSDILDLLELEEGEKEASAGPPGATKLETTVTADPEAQPSIPAHCAVCRRPGPYRCIQCAKSHCSGHFRVMVGLCIRCGGGKEREAEGAEEERDLAEVLGIKWLR